MRTGIFPALLLILLLQGSALAGSIDSFQWSGKEAVADLYSPNYLAQFSLVIPANCTVLAATLKAASIPSTGLIPAYPSGVSVLLDTTTIWVFNGTGIGALGRQQLFSDGSASVSMVFSSGGGSGTKMTRLPKDALVTNATMDFCCTAPVKLKELASFTGYARNDKAGTSVACAGDLNGDGYGDIIIGAANNASAGSFSGAAYILFGGPAMDGIPDVVLPGRSGESFGCSVAAAGDVNGDGYDDAIVGARRNLTPGAYAGKAYLFLGGKNMNSTPDIVFQNSTSWDEFGASVAGAGDVNRDGYDDIIVGAPGNRTAGSSAGMAYIYLGGPSMDARPDVLLRGTVSYGLFGSAVAGSGDVNGDGFGDVIVGGPDEDESGNNLGKARLFYGGNPMDATSDLNLSGGTPFCRFGGSVSSAGDVNSDGYDDLIVGEQANSSGRAYLYYGGPGLDAVPEMSLTGTATGEAFGSSVSMARDVNGDGFDDVVVGASNSSREASKAGRAYVFFGGKGMDSASDVVIKGTAANDSLGCSVSGGGDMDGDGMAEFAAGAQNNDSGGNDSGRAWMFSAPALVPDPSLSAGTGIIWSRAGGFNGTGTVDDFSGAVNGYLSSASPSYTDSSGNRFVDVPITASARGNGTISWGKMNITYQYDTTIKDFSGTLNSYIQGHQAQKSSLGLLTVPVNVRSRTAGRVRLFDLNITFDEPPMLVREIPELRMDEDTVNTSLLHLPDHFRDDADPAENLSFELRSLTNSDKVKVWISGQCLLCADALTGGANDNWTGSVQGTIAVTDSRGLRTDVPFGIQIVNVNDPPLITSEPVTAAESGVLYSHQLRAVDGDRDRLGYSLPVRPIGMTIDAATGLIRWTPARRGEYDVSAAADDGQSVALQNFTIAVPNSPPKIDSVPGTLAYAGTRYVYKVNASDTDGDPLEFSLVDRPEGMSIDPATGMLEWLPASTGQCSVGVAVSDGFGTAYQNFTLLVLLGNHPPAFLSDPPLYATAGKEYSYDPMVSDEDGDAMTFTMTTDATGLRFNPRGGGLRWVPGDSDKGSFAVTLRVSDGKGGVTEQSFIITVEQAPVQTKLKCTIAVPADGARVQGRLGITGTSVRERWNITNVEVAIDAGEWAQARGTEQWDFELDTTKLSNGPHKIHARAYDGTSYSDVATVEIAVDNQPPSSMGLFEALAAVIIVIVAASAAIFIFLRKRRRP